MRVANHAARRREVTLAHDVAARLRAMHVALDELQLDEAPDEQDEDSATTSSTIQR